MGTETRRLLIDDFRDSSVCEVIARNYFDGILCLKYLGPWDKLLLDHDLGDMLYSPEKKRDMTGYDVLCWLEENPEFIPEEIILVTDNPVGMDRMGPVVKKLMKMEKGE